MRLESGDWRKDREQVEALAVQNDDGYHDDDRWRKHRTDDEMPVMVMITMKAARMSACIVPLPAWRDLLLESPCKVKRFLALAAEAEASTEWESGREQD